MTTDSESDSSDSYVSARQVCRYHQWQRGHRNSVLPDAQDEAAQSHSEGAHQSRCYQGTRTQHKDLLHQPSPEDFTRADRGGLERRLGHLQLV